MITRAGLALAAMALALPGLPDLADLIDLHPPAWVERWLYNPRERTGEGLERLGREEGEEKERAGEARRAFEAAGRLAPDDPRVAFNTGTARLLAGRGDAVEALARAATAAPADLAAAAQYNLGTAQLDADDPAGAIAALKQALRLEPGDENAKHNLELALRRLEEKRLRAGEEQEAPDGDRPGEEERSDESGDGEDEGDDQQQEPRPGDDAGDGRDPRDEDQRGEGAGSQPPPAASPLSRFEEQPDMTAAQAAALLAAVESLERAQLRQAAALAARAAGKAEEDW